MTALCKIICVFVFVFVFVYVYVRFWSVHLMGS
jgi:hypothetical protein